MSHIVQIQTQVRDAAGVIAACNRLGLPPPVERTVQLFQATAHGLAVELPGWLYPVVCNLAAGSLQFDNYNGHWGAPAQLNRFLQAYAIEKSRLEACRRGHAVAEQTLADGSVRLTIHVGRGTP